MPERGFSRRFGSRRARVVAIDYDSKLVALLQRDAEPGLTVIVCTGRASPRRRLRGLREGADEWITKPMEPVEIMARIEAVTRGARPVRQVVPETMEFGELLIEPQFCQARIGGHNLGLTRRELDLLVALAGSHGTVVRRADLYRQAWGYSMPAGDRSVDVFVGRIRQKLERIPARGYVHTHFGFGYRFKPPPPSRLRPILTSSEVDRAATLS